MNADKPYSYKILELVCYKLRQAIHQNQYALFYFAIIERAILDLSISKGNSITGSVRVPHGEKQIGVSEEEAKQIRQETIEYLNSNLFFNDCAACGLDSDYAKRIINTLLDGTKPIMKVAA